MNRKQRRAAGATPKVAAPNEGTDLKRRAVEAANTGNHALAIDLYRQLDAANSNDPAIKARLGNSLLLAGRAAEAVEIYNQAICLSPESAEIFSNLGNALVNLGRFDEAVKAHQQAVLLKPDFAFGHFNLGNALLRAGRLKESILALKRTIELKPDLPQAHNDLGNVFYTMGRRQEAIAAYKNALRIEPNFAEAYSNLANPLTDEGRLDEALAMTLRSIQINPNRPEAHSNLGNVLVAADRVKEAIGPYRHALVLKAYYAEAHSNLGHVFGRLGQWDDSIAAYREAIRIRHNYAEAHLYLAMMLLRKGVMIEGWEEYEWRWRTRPFEADEIASQAPFWNGEDLAGKSILIYAEQGLGDTLQFIRYAEILAAKGARVIAAVQAPLVRLMRSVPGITAIIAPGEKLPETDYRAALLSLPRLVGPALTDIPQDIPYLRADETAVAKWKERLSAFPGLKVGLVWAGAARAHDRAASLTDRRRSLSLPQLAPLFDVPGISFFSLQKGETATQTEGLPLHDFMNEIGDFADTAALVSALDMVITVDTSVAHLAGGLGRPVWILSRFDGCWRWLDQGETSPWYPTARLFRQTMPGDWTEAIASLTRALAAQVDIGQESTQTTPCT